MVVFESIEEALGFAASKEAAAKDFYTDMAESSEDETVKAFFKEMVADEQRHKEMLEFEIMKLGKVVSPSIDNSKVRITDITTSMQLPSELSFAEAVILAIKKENASFRLYVELHRYSEDPEISELLLVLAEQELSHKFRLEQGFSELIKKMKEE